jgi:hypothetical protein
MALKIKYGIRKEAETGGRKKGVGETPKKPSPP